MSASSSSPGYDVFLSFQGETRKGVTSHLYKALVNKGISTFKDDLKIMLGDCFPEKIREAIESSRFAIVVISTTYANSRWCLEELRMIMELEMKKEIVVIPVFYDVVPSDVRHTKGTFALTGHHSSKAAMIPKWKVALNLIANLQGTESSKCKDDATMVEDIVKLVSSKLVSTLPMDLGDIVGINAHMEQINPLLHMDSDNDEVRMIGIWGMGGIGKTDIAKYIYKQHKHKFATHHCFMQDVSSGKCGRLQKQLLCYTLGEKDLALRNLEEGALCIKSRLSKLKVFIVLDDVDDEKQMNALAREATWFGPGSRIIITTRDKSLLSSFGVRFVHKVKYLDDDNALQLFHRIAFREENFSCSVYQDLSKHVSRLSQGLPLALETFGRHLRDKSLEEWQDALNSFEKAPNEKIIKVLERSYNKLDCRLSKTAFLHVACLFNGERDGRVMTLLEQGESRIQVLAEKSLLDISDDGSITMHRLLEQTGRHIVLQESGSNTAQQRILWHHDDIYQVLADNAGTITTEAIALDASMMSDEIHIKWDVFKPMRNLSYLKIYKHSRGLESSREDLILENRLIVFRKLRLLHWDAYPFTALPTSISPDCLVELNLCYSKLITLWSGTPRLLQLRKLDLTGSKDLKELPDLEEAVCLEELILEGCISLKRIPKSICSLPRLQKLDVSNCDGLKNLKIEITESKTKRTVFQDTSLSVISVSLKFLGTEPFVPESQGNSLENQSITGSLKIELQHLKGHAEHLCFISEQHISREPMMLELESAPYDFKSLNIMRFNCNSKSGHFKCTSFALFPWLIELNLINLHIQRIPDDISHMQVIEKLDLSGNSFKGLPTTMNLLTKLKHLTLCNCRSLEELPRLSQLESLILSDCTNLRRLVKLDERGYSLLELWLDNCKNLESLSDELSHFTKLNYLDLSRYNFETLPTSIIDLTSLVTLCISYCNNLVSVTELPLSLECLYAHSCNSLKTSSLPPIIHFVDQLDLTPSLHWEQESNQTTQFPAGRRSKKVQVCACACFQETRILHMDYQVTLSILLQRLKPWLWAFAWCILVLGLAILLVGLAILLTSGIDPFPPVPPVLLSIINIYLNTLVTVVFLYYCKKLTFLYEV